MATQILKAGMLYFALVFGAGFVLGTIRTLLVVPRVGTRMAELMEMPIMLVVTIVVSRWVVLRLLVPFVPFARLGMGGIGRRTSAEVLPADCGRQAARARNDARVAGIFFELEQAAGAAGKRKTGEGEVK